MQALAKHWKVLLWQVISPFGLFYMLNLPLDISLRWNECTLSINTLLHLSQPSRHMVLFSVHSKVGKSTLYMKVMETATCKTEEVQLFSCNYKLSETSAHLQWLKICQELKVFNHSSNHQAFPASHDFSWPVQHLCFPLHVITSLRNFCWSLKPWILSVYWNYINSLFFFCISFICIILIFIVKTESECLTPGKYISVSRLPLLYLKLYCFIRKPHFFCIQKVFYLSLLHKLILYLLLTFFTLLSNLSIFPTSFILEMIDIWTSTVSTALLFLPNKCLCWMVGVIL